MPIACSWRALLGPMPGMRATGRGARNAAPPSAGTSSCPSGLARSDAIFAISLQAAMPADDGSPSSPAMRARSARAMSAGAPKRLRDAVTSRKASSSDSGS